MNVWDKLHRSRVIDGIAAQMASGQVSHAWLLLGPRGSGKVPVAMAMAAALDCEREPAVGCGLCSTCARIMRRRHPDVHHIAPEGPLIPVDVIREVVIPEASRSAFEARAKVFIIEEADRMNAAAQNALLKTLEEPQPQTFFILTSDHEEEVLETVMSRCRIVRLDPVPEARMVDLLLDDGVDDELALLVARVSEGDLERARRLAEDETVLERRLLWLRIPSRLTGSVEALDVAAEIVTEARAALKERERAQKVEAEELAEATGETRGTGAARASLAKRHKRELRRLEEEVLGEAMSSIASFYRDVLALRRGGGEGVVNIDAGAELKVWARLDIADLLLLRAAERCVEVRSSLVKNANVPLAIEAALVEIAAAFFPPHAGAAALT